MKKIAHTINRDGKLVQANGFKQPTPTTAMQNNSPLWMHSIDRTDSANPIAGFLILGAALLAMGIIIKYFG
jgi:hypothetical protein